MTELSQAIIAALAEEIGNTPEREKAWIEKYYGSLAHFLRRHHLPDYAALIEEGDRT